MCGRKCGTEICTTVVISSRWNRRHEDPLADKQRWYCPVCSARYKTTNGVLLQMTQGGQDHWIRATFPDEWAKKTKAAVVQAEHPAALNARALLEAIPEATLAPSSFIKKHDRLEGVYIYDYDTLQGTALCDWNDLLARGVVPDTTPEQ